MSSLKEWRVALENTDSYTHRYFHAEMLDVLEAGEKAVAGMHDQFVRALEGFLNYWNENFPKVLSVQ